MGGMTLYIHVMNEIADVLMLCTEDSWVGTDLPVAAPARIQKPWMDMMCSKKQMIQGRIKDVSKDIE